MKIAIALLVALLSAAVFAQTPPPPCVDPSHAVGFLRAYHPKLVDHYLEHDTTKIAAAAQAGYKLHRFVGRLFKDPYPSTVPLYHLYNPKIHDSMYTPHEDKRANALKGGYVDQGVMGYVYPDNRCGGVGLRTMWSAKHGDHFYTTIDIEQTTLRQNGFAIQPWVEGYVLPV